jgi:hypothetical protein
MSNRQPAPQTPDRQPEPEEVVEPLVEVSQEGQEKIVVGFEIMTAQAPLAELLFSKGTDDKNLEAWTNTYGGECPAELFRNTWTTWRAKGENQGELKREAGRALFEKYLNDNNMRRFTEMESDQKPLY